MPKKREIVVVSAHQVVKGQEYRQRQIPVSPETVNLMKKVRLL